jgi:hypothetical protein
MTLYRCVLFFKFIGVLLYAGGLVTSILSSSLEDRKRAVHSVASPALVLVWASGYFLTTQIDVPLTELWVLLGLGLSFCSQLALVRSVAKHQRMPRLASFSACILLALVVLLMVFRPTWQGFAP